MSKKVIKEEKSLVKVNKNVQEVAVKPSKIKEEVPDIEYDYGIEGLLVRNPFSTTVNVAKVKTKKENYAKVVPKKENGAKVVPKKEINAKVVPKKENDVQSVPKKRVKDRAKEFYECPICRKLFRKSYKLADHMVIHTGERGHFCIVCKKSFKTNYRLLKHKKRYHNTVKRPCTICGKVYMTLKGWELHKQKHDSEEIPDKKVKRTIPVNSAEFTCEVCEISFKTKSQYQYHKIGCATRKFECEICKGRYKNQTTLNYHKHFAHYMQVPCEICKKTFEDLPSYKAHEAGHKKWEEVRKSYLENIKKKKLEKTVKIKKEKKVVVDEPLIKYKVEKMEPEVDPLFILPPFPIKEELEES